MEKPKLPAGHNVLVSHLNELVEITGLRMEQ